MKADPNLRISFSDTPLYIAIGNERLDIAELLLENNADSSDGSLHYAVQDGNIDAVILLLNYGADPLQKSHGRNPLQNSYWTEGKSAFDIAIRDNDIEILDILSAVIFSDES